MQNYPNKGIMFFHVNVVLKCETMHDTKIFEIPKVSCHSKLLTDIFVFVPEEKNKEINCMTWNWVACKVITILFHVVGKWINILHVLSVSLCILFCNKEDKWSKAACFLSRRAKTFQCFHSQIGRILPFFNFSREIKLCHAEVGLQC